MMQLMWSLDTVSPAASQRGSTLVLFPPQLKGKMIDAVSKLGY